MKKLFTRENAIRLLTMAGILLGVLVYSIVFIVLLSNSQSATFTIRGASDIPLLIGFVGLFVGVSAIFAALIYLNAKKWMLDCLANAAEQILSWLGLDKLLAKILDPVKKQKKTIKKLKKALKTAAPNTELRRDLETQLARAEYDLQMLLAEKAEEDAIAQAELAAEIQEYESMKNDRSIRRERLRDEVNYEYHSDEYYYGKDPRRSYPLRRLLTWPIRGVKAIVVAAFYVVLAVGLPVVSPFLILIATGGITVLLGEKIAPILLVGLLFLLLTLLIFVGIPLFVLKREKTQAE